MSTPERMDWAVRRVTRTWAEKRGTTWMGYEDFVSTLCRHRSTAEAIQTIEEFQEHLDHVKEVLCGFYERHGM